MAATAELPTVKPLTLSRPRAIVDWLSTIDHKVIGLSYVTTAFIFFLLGAAPNGGWFAYVPLTGPTYSPGINMDFWALGIIFLGMSTVAAAINFVVTIMALRAQGMTPFRMPLFVWTILVTACLMIIAI